VRLETLLTGDFAGIGPLGFTLPRQAWLGRHHSRDLRYDSFALADVQARVYGQAAVITARNNTRGSYRASQFQKPSASPWFWSATPAAGASPPST